MPDISSPDQVAGYLAEVRQRADAATPGPWWSDQDDLMWRLHGVHAVIPAQCYPDGEVMIPEHVMNHQIAKAPKKGTTYAEYWPDAADDAFITAARTDVPRLLAAVEAALIRHQGSVDYDYPKEDRFCAPCGEWWPCQEYQAITRALLGEES